MSTVNKIYSPVTILTEDDFGRIGTEEHKELTEVKIKTRCKWLSYHGWEPVEIQVNDSQYTLPIKWWED